MNESDSRGGSALAEAVRRQYAQGTDDYHLKPMVRLRDGQPLGRIRDGDAVIFCCRRGEREVELTEMFTEPDFDQVPVRHFHDLYFAILTMYHDKFRNLPIAFAPSHVRKPLAEVLSAAGRTQFHCSESEKFAHVTFFFNGGENAPFPGEKDLCIPSPKGIPFDEKPELSLAAVTDAVTDALGSYDFIVTNFANGDVIGHTLNDRAKIEACGCISRGLERVVTNALARDYVVAITADHGNIENLRTPAGKPDGAHTKNPVAFILIDPRKGTPVTLKDGSLADVAPTVLAVMGLGKPAEMTGQSLASGHDFGRDRKMILIICDGWGLGDRSPQDAIHIADTPYWDSLLQTAPRSQLMASGTFVGLEEGKAGNSEAGHLNLGAGRVVMQDDVRLQAALADGSFEQNPVFLSAVAHARKNHSALHLLAYLSHKSSHGSIDYPLSICRIAGDLPEVWLHMIFDGRSTEPGSAPALLEETARALAATGSRAEITDGVGRGIILDRDKNYGRVKEAYDMLTDGTEAAAYE